MDQIEQIRHDNGNMVWSPKRAERAVATLLAALDAANKTIAELREVANYARQFLDQMSRGSLDNAAHFGPDFDVQGYESALVGHLAHALVDVEKKP